MRREGQFASIVVYDVVISFASGHQGTVEINLFTASEDDDKAFAIAAGEPIGSLDPLPTCKAVGLEFALCNGPIDACIPLFVALHPETNPLYVSVKIGELCAFVVNFKVTENHLVVFADQLNENLVKVVDLLRGPIRLNGNCLVGDGSLQLKVITQITFQLQPQSTVDREALIVADTQSARNTSTSPNCTRHKNHTFIVFVILVYKNLPLFARTVHLQPERAQGKPLLQKFREISESNTCTFAIQ